MKNQTDKHIKYKLLRYKGIFLRNSEIIITPKIDKFFLHSEKYKKEKLQFMRRLEDGKLAVGYHHQIGS